MLCIFRRMYTFERIKMGKMLRAVTDLLMPRCCLVCGRQLGVHERHLCLRCEAGLPLTYYWERVHNPMADKLNAVLERQREPGEVMPYVPAAALLFYKHDNPYRRIPQALKYGGNLSVGKAFAQRLGLFLAASDGFSDVDCVIPVPLHWVRRWRRGYNQAEVLARALAVSSGARVAPRALRRVRRTRTQTVLDASERLQNVRSVFRVGHLPAGVRHVLVVDDTFTTGATLAACCTALRAALGPSVRLSVATLSVVDG